MYKAIRGGGGGGGVFGILVATKGCTYHFEWAGRNSVSYAIVIVGFHDKHEASTQQIFVYCEVCTLPPRIYGLSTSK